MTRYIALLRGINVGGKNKIAMPELKAAFLSNGFLNVDTYINSGNILFDSELDPEDAKNTCENIIESEFRLKIVVCIITAADLIEAMNNAPDWWGKDADTKHNAIFVIPPATAAEVCASAGEASPEYEKVYAFGSVIFWSAPIKTFSHTRWSKVVSDKATYNLITIRNSNTAQKLAAMSEKQT